MTEKKIEDVEDAPKKGGWGDRGKLIITVVISSVLVLITIGVVYILSIQ